MKRMMLIAAFAAAGVMASLAGELITKEVAVPSGATNAVQEFTLNFSASPDAPEIDAIVYGNGGDATGTLAFAAADIGAARSLGDAVTALPGAGGAVYPVRTQVAAGATNAVPWRARTLRVTVTQDNTNAAVYTVGVITR